jgi:multiple sugar transport system substrate-binding protein
MGLATTRRSAWLSDGFKEAIGAQAVATTMINLQHADVERSKAIFFHPQSARVLAAFMIGVNEVVSGAKSAEAAMTAAAKKANAMMRG